MTIKDMQLKSLEPSELIAAFNKMKGRGTVPVAELFKKIEQQKKPHKNPLISALYGVVS